MNILNFVTLLYWPIAFFALVASTSSPNKATDVDNNALWLASKNGDLQEVRHLLALEDIDVAFAHNYAIRCASGNGHLEIVKFLLENGADATAGDNDPIQSASLGGHLEIVKLLLAYGANASAKDNEPIFLASFFGYLEIVKLLLAKGADATARNNEPIRAASFHGRLEIVQLLLAYGANATVNDNGPICCASEKGRFKIVKLLLANGADATARDNDPICRASENGHFEIVKLLLANGADATAGDNRPIRIASEKGHLEIVKLLLANGADDDMVRSRLGNAHYWLFRILSRKIVVTADNNDAIRRASEVGNIAEVELLLRNGTDPTAMDYRAIRLAAQNGHFGIVKLLARHYNIDIFDSLISSITPATSIKLEQYKKRIVGLKRQALVKTLPDRTWRKTVVEFLTIENCISYSMADLLSAIKSLEGLLEASHLYGKTVPLPKDIIFDIMSSVLRKD